MESNIDHEALNITHGFPYSLPSEQSSNYKEPCQDCTDKQSLDISTEQLKLITDRLDAIHGCLYWMCQTLSSMLTSNPMIKMMTRKAMNTSQGQHHAD